MENIFVFIVLISTADAGVAMAKHALEACADKYDLQF